MARRSGLGKGLETLIPRGPTPTAPSEGFAIVPTDRIAPNPQQPRSVFDADTLASLAASIAEVGLLQPLVVRKGTDGYVLIAGERRLRACALAGIEEVPVVIRDANDEGSLVEALVENVQREDLNPLEEAAAYQQLLEDFGMTHQQVGERVSKSRSSVTNALRLLTLPPLVQGFVSRGELSAGHARALAGLEDQRYAEHIAKRAVSEGWSVRQTEEAARLRTGGQEAVRIAPSPGQPERPIAIVELEQRLTEKLDADVAITFGKNKGRVVIKFSSIEDLERIYRELHE